MIRSLEPVFVDSIPKVLEEGKLYISKKYSTAVHKCCCGCGQKVITPLRPTDWRLRERGGRVSLWPSIGNWSFPCRSHYWIVENQVQWSYAMSQGEIEAGRRRDAAIKDRFYRTGQVESAERIEGVQPPDGTERPMGLWQKLKRWFLG